MTSSTQRNVCGTRLRLSWRGFRARDRCRSLPLVASDRFLQRDAACTWRRSYSAETVHNLRGPERVRGQGARTCWVQAIVASDCVRALEALSAAAPEALVSTAPPPPAAVPAIWWVRVLARIPLAALYGVAHLVAWMAYRVVPYRKQLVQASLATAFPELSEGELRAVRHRYYLRFAEMAVELIKASAFAPAEIRRRVRIVNLEEPQALLAQGQSVLLIAAHQSNWEWMLLALSLELGYPLDAREGAAARYPQAPRRGARHSHGRRPGADHQRAQVLDAFPQPRHRLLHGSGGDCACHALPGVLHRHASPGARLLRDGVPAARRRRRCHAARRAH